MYSISQQYCSHSFLKKYGKSTQIKRKTLKLLITYAETSGTKNLTKNRLLKHISENWNEKLVHYARNNP